MSNRIREIEKAHADKILQAQIAKVQLYKYATGLPAFWSDDEAVKFLDYCGEDFTDKTKGMKPAEMIKFVRGMSYKDAVQNLGKKEKAVRMFTDMIDLPSHILAGTKSLEQNWHIQKMLRTGRIKSLTELITHPEVINVFTRFENVVTNTAWDANWTLAFTQFDLTGIASNKAEIVDLFMNADFVRLDMTEKIKFRTLGDDSLSEIKAQRFGDGFEFDRSLFNNSPAETLNRSLQALMVGNEESKSTLAYAELTDSGKYAGTTTGTAATLAADIAGFNSVGYTLKNKFRTNDRKHMRVTSATPILLYVNDGPNADRAETALEAQSQAGGTGAIEVVSHTYQVVRSLQVPALIDTVNNGCLATLAGGKHFSATFATMETFVEEIKAQNMIQVGAQVKRRVDNQDADQSQLFNFG